jgi:S1/P1 Nuclease
MALHSETSPVYGTRAGDSEQKAKYSHVMILIMSSRWLPAAVCSLSLLLLQPMAWAWGVEGHRIIADIAWDYLSDATLKELEPLLGDDDLASISTWADDIRKDRPETGPWHYVNIAHASGYQPSDCPDDNCVVARIARFAAILADPQQPLEKRSEALKFLVHFVGDLSQPMHAMAEARGGNDIPVTMFGSSQCGKYPCNLHSVWDSALIQHTGLREHRYARRLEKKISREHLQAGPKNPVAWANQSLRLGKKAWVQPQTAIHEAYYLKERPVVDQQLALGGLRLAEILNETLGGARPKAGY